MWCQTVRTCRLTPDESEVNVFGGQIMLTLNPRLRPSQGIACLRTRSRWLPGDIKKELDEILSSSEFRAIRFELEQMRYIFLKGPQFSYRLIGKLFDKSKSHVHTLLTAREMIEEVHFGNKILLMEERRGHTHTHTHSACLRCALRASLRLRWSVGSVRKKCELQKHENF